MKHFIAFVTLGLAMVVLTSAKITCPVNTGDASIYFPHETECGKFYECSSRQAILFECPPGTYFDVNSNVCDFRVDCGNLATSTPPPTTEAQNA